MFSDFFNNLLFFFLYVIINPRLIKPLINGLYLPVYVQFEWLKKYNFSTIIDVGAYHGHVTKVLHYLFPTARIYAFEPLEENIRYIKSHVRFNGLHLEKFALSSTLGKKIFYKTEYLPASSLLKLSNSIDNQTTSENIKTIVNSTTLDAYFKNINLKGNVLLKSDVQGAEDQVLRGGSAFLKKVSVIHIETSFKKLYLGSCSFSQIYNILSKKGFEYCGSVPDGEFYPIFNPNEASNSIFISKDIRQQ
ncbi:MAG: hypothetical protein US96_C0002G0016 [Candidatus Woesebacteria bacterium GW2011_GWB1_38_5b]|uniref:Methyltransferase FkbM domain-containing protein n=1 Tax=Candidatus Woesebacteria bacterium GW2011_GWB1_38_5b TaxID=1618569 RepID=A0A0G0K8A8_9BACT|nr:MAG: hypothetical protein US96_C0002G0016 [Candidatus Woesebacteria bacterium GW2011_GWB1_38_5b]